MKCEICGNEIANSEAMKEHMEREHPAGAEDDDGLEAPDLMNSAQEAAPVIPGKNN